MFLELAENLLKSDLYQFISDVSKNAQGFRTRFDYRDMTVAELEDEADHWCKMSDLAEEEEQAHQETCIDLFEAAVANLIEIGARDRITAIRWMRDQDDEQIKYDDGYFKYTNGLPYSYSLTGGMIIQ